MPTPLTRVFVCAALTVFCVTSYAMAAQPVITLSQPSWNFGEVWHPQTQTLRLIISNKGDADLEIRDVRTTCGCTVANPEARVVTPGGQTILNVQYDTANKQGRVTSKVIIKSNDPLNPEVDLPIEGVVKRAIEREPLGGLVIRTNAMDAGQDGKVRLTNQLTQPMRLDLRGNNLEQWLDVRVEEVTPGLVYDVYGRTKRKILPGVLRGELTFMTGLQDEPSFTVSVRIQVIPEVEASPVAFLFQPGDGAPPVRTVRIASYRDDPQFEVISAECDDPRISVQLGSTGPAVAWMKTIKPVVQRFAQARIQVPGEVKLPPQGIKVKFLTNDREYPVVEVLLTPDREDFNAAFYKLPANVSVSGTPKNPDVPAEKPAAPAAQPTKTAE